MGDVLVQPTALPEGADYTLRVVTYTAGAQNVPHRHSSDQIIIVTAGAGLVGAEQELLEVAPGDIVFIPALQYHWHGANSHSEVTQVSITGASSVTEPQPVA